MTYTIVITETALKQLAKLPGRIGAKIEKSIDGLSMNPRPVGVKKLKGSKENLYRIRVGDYRVIYNINDDIRVVDVRKIGHRKDIYI